MEMELERKRGSNSVKVVAGTDALFTSDQRHGLLHLPVGSKVAVDTSVLVYLAQRGVEDFRAKAEIVEEFFCLPVEFVIAQPAFTELVHVLLKSSKPVSGLDDECKNPRQFRLKSILSLFEYLKRYEFAQAECSRGAYLNPLRLTATTRIQPYDARLIIESLLPEVHVFVCEDMAHSQVIACVREDVQRKVVLWNILAHGLQIYMRRNGRANFSQR